MKRVNFWKYIGRVKLEGRNSRETSSIIFSLVKVVLKLCESCCFCFLFFSFFFCFFLRNCAPALSIIQNGAVGRALPELIHHPRGVSLWQWRTVEALPPQTLRRFPPVSIVAAADGAVVHLHVDPGWDDRCSSKAIWTCRMGKGRKGGGETGKGGIKRQEMDAYLLRASLCGRNCGAMQRAVGSWGESE